MWITFFPSVPGSADSISDSPPDCDRLAAHLERSAWSKGKPIAAQSWVSKCRRGGWINVLSGAEISETFPSMPWLELIGFAPDTHASHSAKPATKSGRTIPDTFGPSSDSKSGHCVQQGFSWKTLPDTSESVCGMFSRIWRGWVIAVRGACTQRRKWAHRTEENEFSSLLWPTPTRTADQTASSMVNHPGWAAFWPTPTVQDAHNNGSSSQHERKVLPLNAAVGRPDLADHSGQTSHPGQLNPKWVEMLMGFPAGWTDCER